MVMLLNWNGIRFTKLGIAIFVVSNIFYVQISIKFYPASLKQLPPLKTTSRTSRPTSIVDEACVAA